MDIGPSVFTLNLNISCLSGVPLKPGAASNTHQSGECVSDCSHMPQGDYQSCKTCAGFVFCSNGLLYDMPCGADFVWDDVTKRCEWESMTCPPTTSRPSTVGPTGPHDPCVSDCSGMPSGDYQSCKTCEGYVYCSDGFLYDRPCLAGLLWDDLTKRCEYESKTCPSTPSHPSTGDRCVSDCSGIPNGNYQSCKTCEGYVYCSDGFLYDRPCLAGLLWDDLTKRCEYESKTCPSTTSHPSTGDRCVSDCSSIPNGDYQSCKTCEGYVYCSDGFLYDRPCLVGLLWDDLTKRCEYESKTCPSTTNNPSTGDRCVSDCSGIPNGNYQSCKTCEGYVYCSDGFLYDRPCLAGLLWDDLTKRCEYESKTCPSTTSHPSTGDRCVSDCSGIPNGDYQSCKTCEGYIICSDGFLCDRPCLTGLLWNDVTKSCEWKSATCDIPSAIH